MNGIHGRHFQDDQQQSDSCHCEWDTRSTPFRQQVRKELVAATCNDRNLWTTQSVCAGAQAKLIVTKAAAENVINNYALATSQAHHVCYLHELRLKGQRLVSTSDCPSYSILRTFAHTAHTSVIVVPNRICIALYCDPAAGELCMGRSQLELHLGKVWIRKVRPSRHSQR